MGGALGSETQDRRRGWSRDFQEQVTTLPPLAQLWEQLCPAEAGVGLVLLQLGRVIPVGCETWSHMVGHEAWTWNRMV